MKGEYGIDNYELREDVQKEVMTKWNILTNENLKEFADLQGFRNDFLRLFGFGIQGVNYEEDVEHQLKILSIM